MSKWLMSSNVSRVWRNMPHGHQLPDGPHFVNFVGNSNNGFCSNQGFNARWNKPSFPFDNRQQGGMVQNFYKSEPSFKNIVQDQLRINSEVGKKLLANERILESIDCTMNNLIVAVHNHQNFNKVFDMNIRDGSFELKPALINMVQKSPFCGKALEDANAHLQHFLEICRIAH
jgi:hypothetical protein